MFGYDPIDIFDPSPYGALAYYGHYIFGSIALIASLVALWVRKGRRTHRIAGFILMGSVAVLSLTTVSMLLDRFIPPLALAAITSIYVIAGAWLALRKGTAAVRAAEIGLTVLEVAGLSVFLAISVPLALSGDLPIFAPFLIGFIPVVLLIGDANWFLNQDKRERLRVARHLSRMVWGFVVVLRAPLVEIAAAGAPIPALVVIVGPILLAIAMLWYFQRRYGGSPFGKNPKRVVV